MAEHLKRFSKALICTISAATLVFSTAACSKKYVQLDDVDLANFETAEIGEEIAVLDIEYMNEPLGQLRIKLFEQQVPDAVKNFKSLINIGYYDDCVFFYIADDYCVMSGDPSGLGTGGHAAIETVCTPSNQLCNFTGAVGFAAQNNYCDSRFYIVSGGTVTAQDFVDYAMQDSGKYFAQNVKSVYLDVGGQPGLDNNTNMVFGQIFEEDLEILQKIDSVEVNSQGRPSKAVIIKSAKIVEYQE